MFSWQPLRCIDFLPPPLLRNSPLKGTRGTKYWMTESWEICHHFLCVGSVPFLFWSRGLERPMTARESVSIIRNCLRIVFTSFFVSFCSPIQCRWTLTWRWSCLWSAKVYTVSLSLDSESSRGGPASWCLGAFPTRTPSACRRFDSYPWSDCFPNTI